MAEKRIKPCHDCGLPMVLARGPAGQHQKYCTLCRLARGAIWHDGRAATCACGREYIAWNGRKAQRMCGFCFAAASPTGGRESIVGTCVWHPEGRCHSDTVTTLAHENVKLCYPCLHDPLKFEPNRASLVQKQQGLTRTK